MRQFIQDNQGAVIRATEGTALFPSVILAQMILESGWGSSTLSSKFNNYFGIKAGDSWTGPVASLDTLEVIQGQGVEIRDLFRVYTSPEDSLRDLVKLYTSQARYKGVLQAENPQAQAQAIQAAGYATDPSYYKKIIDTINANALLELDAKKKDMKKMDIILVIALGVILAVQVYKLVKY